MPSRTQNLASASEGLKSELDPELRGRFNLTTEDSKEYIAFYCLVNPYVTADEILATRAIRYVVHDPYSLQDALEANDSLRQGLRAFSKQIKKIRRAHHSESSNAENVFGSDPRVDAATQELAELEKIGRERGWLI